MITKINTPNRNEFDNTIHDINYRTLVSIAENQLEGLSEKFLFLKPDLRSPDKESEYRKSRVVDTLIMSANSGVELQSIDDIVCEIDSDLWVYDITLSGNIEEIPDNVITYLDKPVSYGGKYVTYNPS